MTNVPNTSGGIALCLRLWHQHITQFLKRLDFKQ